MDDDTPVEQPESQMRVVAAKKRKEESGGNKKQNSKEKKVLQIGSTSIIKVKGADGENFFDDGEVSGMT